MRHTQLSIAFILALALTGAPPATAGIVLTGTAGADSHDHFRGAAFAYNAALYAKFDDMTLLGVQAGQGTVASTSDIPITGTALIRLPIGRVVLPVAIGDVGYVLGDKSGLIWKGGGGFDIRNGRRSSFLALGAYERKGSLAGWSARLGLLLEF